MMEELTTAIKNLKKRIEGTVNRVNSKAESKLLAIKAIEELIGFSHVEREVKSESKSLVQYDQTNRSSRALAKSI
jgi:predicted xylose isomerase-like sugar epimerase